MTEKRMLDENEKRLCGVSIKKYEEELKWLDYQKRYKQLKVESMPAEVYTQKDKLKKEIAELRIKVCNTPDLELAKNMIFNIKLKTMSLDEGVNLNANKIVSIYKKEISQIDSEIIQTNEIIMVTKDQVENGVEPAVQAEKEE